MESICGTEEGSKWKKRNFARRVYEDANEGTGILLWFICLCIYFSSLILHFYNIQDSGSIGIKDIEKSTEAVNAKNFTENVGNKIADLGLTEV